MSYECIDIEQAKAMISEEQAVVIDIRDANSFSAGAIQDAIHIDNSNVENFLESADFEKPLIVCCYHGNMSKGAAEFFASRGFARSYSLNGGYTLWAQQA